MEQALLDIYKKETPERINKCALKGLLDRELVDDSNIITTKGTRYALSKLPLAKQCEQVGINLETLKLSYQGRPEAALLKHYEEQGYTGVNYEGTGILTVIKALALDKLADLNYFHDRNDACTRYLEAQLTILRDSTSEIISSIKRTTKERFISNFKEIIEKPRIKSDYPYLSIEFASKLFDAIGKETFVNILAKLAEEPYTYRNGWPDLTLVKGKEVLFIEVKTTDKLHESQLITIPEMRTILPSEFKVCKVVK